jgi:formylmethanofuran dehydrogenase subunit B
LESVLTWQTGYPFAVDFAPGYPAYAAGETVAERLERGRFTAALVLGNPATIPEDVAMRFGSVPTVAIGPRASEAPFSPHVTIDTGAASLHEAGLVLRMDDVPVHASPVLSHPRSVTDVLRALSSHLPAQTPAEVG